MLDPEFIASMPVKVFLCVTRGGHAVEFILTLKNEVAVSDLISSLKVNYEGNLISIALESGNEFMVDPSAIIYLYRLPNAFAYSNDTVVLK